jgi:hypothetical protein
MLTGKTISELPKLSSITDEMVIPVELSGITYHIDYLQIANDANAYYFNTDTQVVSGSNVPSVVMLNSVGYENNISLVDNSKIVVGLDGVYEVGASYQLGKATLVAASATISFWARIDGVDAPDSGGQIVLVNNSDKTLPYIPYNFDLVAGQYIELVFVSSDDTAQVFALPAISVPYEAPAIPSTIVTITKLS